MGRTLSLAVLVAAAAVGYALLRAAPPPQVRQDPEDAAIAPHRIMQLDAEAAPGAAARLAGALAINTVGDKDASNHVGNVAAFQQMHAYLERSFPLVYEKLEHRRVNVFSILFTWRGSRPELRPLLTMSHIDVVPAPTEGQGANWTYPPFSGTIADGFIWGRGALDVKSSALQQLEALSLLLREGFTPTRTILLAFGHDEEVGGQRGAAAIASLLSSEGVELEVVVDEGGVVMTDGVKAGSMTVVDGPMAVVGTAEKGFESWEIEVKGSGGHSSLPPVDGSSVAARISRILAAIDAYPTTTKLGPPTTDWLEALAPAATLAPLRTLMGLASNKVVNPILGQLMGSAGSRELNAFVRTTCSVVSIQAGGIADNVLPGSGRIMLNFRPLPGQGSDFIREYLQMVTRKEADYVTLRPLPRGAVPATPVAPSHGPHFQMVKQAILETLQPPMGLKVVPYLVSGMTDSRHYLELAGGRVYRFCPQSMTTETIRLVHGVDERIAVDDYLRGIGFYKRLYELASSDESSTEAGGSSAAAAAAGSATD